MKLIDFVTPLSQSLCSWSFPAWSKTLLMVGINETQKGQVTGWELGSSGSSLPLLYLNPSEIQDFSGCETLKEKMTYVIFLLCLLYIKLIYLRSNISS